ncbi:MAG TPA: response regulator [Puia sp.]|jgi:DNA-binding NarL/FixJ family response regulator|nr:response regulator [Puia sp.]
MNEAQLKYDSVLVIDDHKMVILGLRLTIGVLFSAFYHTREGSVGVAMAKKYQPQLVIVDNQLPDLTGDAVVREIRRYCPQARILGYSFTMDADPIRKMYEAGIHGYVDKSEADVELSRAVRHLLEGGEYFSKEARIHLPT